MKKEQAPTDSHQSQKKRDIRQVEGQSGRENDVKAARSSTDPESLRPAALSAESVSKFTDDEIFAAITAELNFLDTDGYSIGDAEMDLFVSAALRHSLIQDYVRWVDDPEWKFGYDDALEDLKDFVAWLESEESHMDLPETEMPKEIPPDKEAPLEEPKEAPLKESKRRLHPRSARRAHHPRSPRRPCPRSPRRLHPRSPRRAHHPRSPRRPRPRSPRRLHPHPNHRRRPRPTTPRRLHPRSPRSPRRLQPRSPRRPLRLT